jgi:hypothetical protein
VRHVCSTEQFGVLHRAVHPQAKHRRAATDQPDGLRSVGHPGLSLIAWASYRR